MPIPCATIYPGPTAASSHRPDPMDAKTFYRLQGPSEWKKAPERFSYSSLKRLEECPLRWQLANSSYGELPRYPSRPSASIETGTIVHDALEKLFRGLAQRGLPPIG